MRRLAALLLLAFCASACLSQSQGSGSSSSSFGTPNSGYPPIVSAATPLYFQCHIRDDAQAMFFSISNNAANYQQIGNTPYVPAVGWIRDPSCVYVPSNGTFFFAGTAPVAAGSFIESSSTNLSSITTGTTVVTGTGTQVWSPRFTLDASGNYWVVISSGASVPTTPYIATWNPTTNAFGTFSAITINSQASCPGGQFDYRILYNPPNSTYYMVYSCSSVSQQYIQYASATAITGPYTRLATGTTDYFGFGQFAENPDLFFLPNGNVRIFSDTYNQLANPRFYQRKYVDMNTNFTVFAGSVTSTTGPEQEAGTNITISSPTVANIVYAIAQSGPYPANFTYGGLGINGPNFSPYSITLNNLSNTYPNAFNAGYPTIAIENLDNSLSILGSSQGNQLWAESSTGIGYPSGTFGAEDFLVAPLAGASYPNWNLGASNGANLFELYQSGTNPVSGFPLLVYGAPFAGDSAAAGLAIEAQSCYQWNTTTTGVTVGSMLCSPGNNIYTFGSTAASGNGTIEAAALLPGVIYSAAGTVLPTCASGIKGQLAVVSDATTPTYHGAYTGGGAITTQVICSYNGSTYSWLTQ